MLNKISSLIAVVSIFLAMGLAQADQSNDDLTPGAYSSHKELIIVEKISEGTDDMLVVPPDEPPKLAKRNQDGSWRLLNIVVNEDKLLSTEESSNPYILTVATIDKQKVITITQDNHIWNFTFAGSDYELVKPELGTYDNLVITNIDDKTGTMRAYCRRSGKKIYLEEQFHLIYEVFSTNYSSTKIEQVPISPEKPLGYIIKKHGLFGSSYIVANFCN